MLTRAALTAMRYELGAGRRLMHREDWVTILQAHAESHQRFHTRNPFASGGDHEDPATGAATAAFAGYLSDIAWLHNGVIDIVQGEDIGQGSRLKAEIPAIEGHSIRVSGNARWMERGPRGARPFTSQQPVQGGFGDLSTHDPARAQIAFLDEVQSLQASVGGPIFRVDVGFSPVEMAILEAVCGERSQGFIHVSPAPGRRVKSVPDFGTSAALVDVEERAGSSQDGALDELDSQAEMVARGQPRAPCSIMECA